MKKFLSLLMVMAMLFTMAAVSATAESDVVTLDVFYASTRPMNEATELTRQYMIDNLGVDFNMIQGDSANFDQQLALYITSGDMPDVIWCSYSVWNDYAQQGAWADISSYISEEKTPELMSYVGDSWAYMTIDGGIYGVPSMLDVPTSHVTGIRTDWLNNLGLEAPTTIDEFTEVMRAFTFNDPDGNGENDTYGVSGAGAGYLSFLMGAFGSSTERDNFMNEDGTIRTNAISEEYKNALKYLRDIYAEGLIDPEMFTASYDQAQGKWGRGEMGIWPCWWSHTGNAYLRFDFGSLQPDAKVGHVLPPVGENGVTGALHSAPFSTVIGISYLCTEEEIEAAVKLLEFEASPFGFRTVQYGVVDEFFEWDEANNQTTWTWGINGNKSKSGQYETTDMEVYKMLYHEDWQAQAHELEETVANIQYVSGSDMRYVSPIHEDLFCMFVTDATIEYKSELDTYFNTNMLAFIMGEKDIDADWDAYVEEYLSMGGEEERQSQLEAYNATFGVEATFAY